MELISGKNRGMLLESIINKTITLYKENDVAIFHKKELPVAFAKIVDGEGKMKVKNGFVKSKSTADYYGVYQGKFVAFEAKSTQLSYVPAHNFKVHQIAYLKDVARHGGLAFFIIMFTLEDEFYVLDIDKIKSIGKRLAKSEVQKLGYKLELIYPGIIDFVTTFKQMKGS